MDRIALKGSKGKTHELYGDYRPAPMYLYDRGKYLSADAKLVYIVLVSFKNDLSGLCCPSYESLMDRTSLPRGRIVKALNELDHFHWIGRMNIVGSSNHYEVIQPPVRNLRLKFAQKDEDDKGKLKIFGFDGEVLVAKFKVGLMDAELDKANRTTPLEFEAKQYAAKVKSNKTAKAKRRKLKLVA